MTFFSIECLTTVTRAASAMEVDILFWKSKSGTQKHGCGILGVLK